MKLYKADGVVLRAWDCGSGDKLLVLFSKEHGKIKVMAHGAAKPASRKRGAVQSFTRSSFLIRRGRELDSVSQCEGVEMFPFLRSDLARLGYASYLAELVDALAPEGEPNEPLFNLLLVTMRLLAEGDPELLARAFEIRAAALLGYRPVLEECAACQNPVNGQPSFSPGLGGVVCQECAASAPGAAACSRGAVETMKTMLKWRPERLRQLKVDRATRGQLKALLQSFLRYHLERDLKSAAFLDRISGFGESDV